MANTDTIGTSLQFPIQLLNGGGETVSGDDNIHQSIFTLLGVDEPTFFAAAFYSLSILIRIETLLPSYRQQELQLYFLFFIHFN